MESRLRRQRQSDEAADLVAALDFQDLLLVERELGTSELRSLLEEHVIDALSKFRDRIMHSVLQPASDDPEHLDQLLDQMKLIGQLLIAVADRQEISGR